MVLRGSWVSVCLRVRDPRAMCLLDPLPRIRYGEQIDGPGTGSLDWAQLSSWLSRPGPRRCSRISSSADSGRLNHWFCQKRRPALNLLCSHLRSRDGLRSLYRCVEIVALFRLASFCQFSDREMKLILTGRISSAPHPRVEIVAFRLACFVISPDRRVRLLAAGAHIDAHANARPCPLRALILPQPAFAKLNRRLLKLLR